MTPQFPSTASTALHERTAALFLSAHSGQPGSPSPARCSPRDVASLLVCCHSAVTQARAALPAFRHGHRGFISSPPGWGGITTQRPEQNLPCLRMKSLWANSNHM